jgi:hypothetical protein
VRRSERSTILTPGTQEQSTQRERIGILLDRYLNAGSDEDRNRLRDEIFRHDGNGAFAKRYLRELRARIADA